jgi:hypothetical protein
MGRAKVTVLCFVEEEEGIFLRIEVDGTLGGRPLHGG